MSEDHPTDSAQTLNEIPAQAPDPRAARRDQKAAYQREWRKTQAAKRAKADARRKKHGERRLALLALMTPEEQERRLAIRRSAAKRNYRANREYYVAAAAAYDKLYPERRRAWDQVARALKDGTIAKHAACERCGNAKGRLTAHHHDYSKPLEVIWLCGQCHRSEHPIAPVGQRGRPSNHRRAMWALIMSELEKKANLNDSK